MNVLSEGIQPATPNLSSVSAFRDVQVVSREQLAQLMGEQDADVRQTSFDTIFTDAHRVDLLTTASEDRLGRKVLYYRYMNREVLFELLEKGELTAIDHHPEPDGAARDHLAAYLLGPLEASGVLSGLEALKYYEKGVQGIAESGILGEGLSRALLELDGEFTYRNILPILDKYTPEEYRLRGHVSTVYIEFTPFISLSIGGPILDRFPDFITYVEMIIPDDEITLSPEAFNDESEVFARRLCSSWITKVHDSWARLERAVTHNPATIVGQRFESGDTQPAQNWAADEDIEDFLPTSLL